MLQLPFTRINLGYETAGPGLGVGATLSKAHDDDAAFDLSAAEDVYLAPGCRALVKTGLVVAIPEGHAGLVLPRSGLALKHGITVLNAPGLIDPGYRGEVGVILHNTAPAVVMDYDPDEGYIPRENEYAGFTINRGDRIAQLLIIRTTEMIPQYFSDEAFNNPIYVPQSTRGASGFGSSGR